MGKLEGHGLSCDSSCCCVCRPAYATPKILDKTGLKLSDIDVFEYHEAFAVSCSYNQAVNTVAASSTPHTQLCSSGSW